MRSSEVVVRASVDAAPAREPGGILPSPLAARAADVAGTLALPTAPRLSVVVVATAAAGVPRRELSTIVTACARVGAEVVVVLDGSPRSLTSTRTGSHSVRYVLAPATATTADCRRLGLGVADGDVVLLVDDRSPFTMARLDRAFPARTDRAD